MPVVGSSGNHSQKSFIEELAINASSGALAGYTCFPFEGLKKRYQRKELQSSDFFNLKNGRLLNALRPPELYRGAVSFTSAVAINAGTGLTIAGLLKKLPFYDSEKETHVFATDMLGAAAGAIVASTPVENTIVIQQSLKVGPIQAWKYMLSQGITRPWVGVAELITREIGFVGCTILYFGPKIRDHVQEKTNNAMLATLSYAGTGVVFAVLTHPADTLATWRQKRDGKITVIEGIKELHSSGGAKAFFRGVLPRIFLFTGCFSIIETVPRLIHKKMEIGS